MSDLYQPRSRSARLLGPKRAQAVRDLRGLQKRLREQRQQRLGKAMIDAVD